MVKIRGFSRCLLVAAVVAGSICCVRPALAADGYEGLVAAPSDDKTPAQNGAQATPGYSGVVADPSAEPAESAEQPYTPTPGRGGPHVTDLRTAAIVSKATALRPTPPKVSQRTARTRVHASSA